MISDALAIHAAAVAAVDPTRLVIDHLRVHPPPRSEGLRVLGAGKAAAAMARGVEVVFGGRGPRGVVVVKDGHGLPLQRIEVLEAGHPEPDDRSLAAGARLMAEARGLGPDDAVMGLWSGGGSALVEVLRPGWDLPRLHRVVATAVADGADIREINALRRSASALKGGGLAAICRAPWTNLVLSDVAGDDPALVASGPAVVRGDGTHVIGNLSLARRAAVSEAVRRGYDCRVVASEVAGRAADLGRALAATLVGHDLQGPPICRIWTGEPTVALSGSVGTGGRMQHAALAAAIALDAAGVCGVILCAGTDGTDGPTDVAGAVVDQHTVAKILASGRDPRDHLIRHDATPALDSANACIRTGPTLTNVRDVMLVLARGTAG